MLDWAGHRGWGDPANNAAAGWRLAARPRITAALEADELAALIAAAATPRPARRQIAAVAARTEPIVRLRVNHVIVRHWNSDRIVRSITGAEPDLMLPEREVPRRPTPLRMRNPMRAPASESTTGAGRTRRSHRAVVERFLRRRRHIQVPL